MKNSEIILHKSVNLMNRGILKGTNAYFHYTYPDGEKVYIKIPEPIYNKAEIEAHGWTIREGVVPNESLVIKIWVPSGGHFIRKKVQFYTQGQIKS